MAGIDRRIMVQDWLLGKNERRCLKNKKETRKVWRAWLKW
jgi:hypothetical protein